MTLGTSTPYRKLGLGIELIQRCLLKATLGKKCGTIYLHVIVHNSSTMRLYERMGFVNLRRLSNYYCIDGKEFDCYLYAKFANGNGTGACVGDEGGGEGKGPNVSKDFVGGELISNTTVTTIVTTALSSQWTAAGNARLAAGGWMYYRYYGCGIDDNDDGDECDGNDDEVAPL